MIWEGIIQTLVNDLMMGLNLVIILYIILHFVKRYILPEIPKWMKQYRDTMLEYHAIVKAKGVK